MIGPSQHRIRLYQGRVFIRWRTVYAGGEPDRSGPKTQVVTDVIRDGYLEYDLYLNKTSNYYYKQKKINVHK